MSLQEDTNLILKILHEDFDEKGYDIKWLKRDVPFAKDSIHVNTDESIPGTPIKSPYEGVNKKELFEYGFNNKISFENALKDLEMRTGFIVYADNDPELEPWELPTEDMVGWGPRKQIRLTMSGYLQADNTSQPKASFTKYFHFVDKTFHIETIGGETESWYLSAITKYTLLLALVTILNKKGKIVDGWALVDFSQSELSSTLRNINPKLPIQLEYWIKNTKGNLIKTIPDNIKELIAISDFSRTSQTYTFKIKLPI